ERPAPAPRARPPACPAAWPGERRSPPPGTSNDSCAQYGGRQATESEGVQRPVRVADLRVEQAARTAVEVEAVDPGREGGEEPGIGPGFEHGVAAGATGRERSEEHTSELQSREKLV